MSDFRRPISFIATDAPELLVPFYRDVLGLQLMEHSPFAIVFDDGGMMLRVQIVSDFRPVAYTVHGWEVSNIKTQIRSLSEHGVETIRYPELNQDDHGIWTTPNGDAIAWFNDPSGNILSLTQYAIK